MREKAHRRRRRKIAPGREVDACTFGPAKHAVFAQTLARHNIRLEREAAGEQRRRGRARQVRAGAAEGGQHVVAHHSRPREDAEDGLFRFRTRFRQRGHGRCGHRGGAGGVCAGNVAHNHVRVPVVILRTHQRRLRGRGRWRRQCRGEVRRVGGMCRGRHQRSGTLARRRGGPDLSHGCADVPRRGRGEGWRRAPDMRERADFGRVRQVGFRFRRRGERARGESEEKARGGRERRVGSQGRRDGRGSLAVAGNGNAQGARRRQRVRR
jgi:hypothetical protein